MLPTYVIRSYLPNDTILNVDTILNGNNERSIIEVESAIVRKQVQQIDLPIVSYDSDDNLDLVLNLRLVIIH